MKLAAADATGATAQGPARTIQRWDDDVRVAEDGGTVIAVCAVPVTITQEPGHSGDALTLPSGKDCRRDGRHGHPARPDVGPRSVGHDHRARGARRGRRGTGRCRTHGRHRRVRRTRHRRPGDPAHAALRALQQPGRHRLGGLPAVSRTEGPQRRERRERGRRAAGAGRHRRQARRPDHDHRGHLVGREPPRPARGRRHRRRRSDRPGRRRRPGRRKRLRRVGGRRRTDPKPQPRPPAGAAATGGAADPAGSAGPAGPAASSPSARPGRCRTRTGPWCRSLPPPSRPRASSPDPAARPGTRARTATAPRGAGAADGFAYKMAMSFTTTVIQDRAAGDWGSPGTIDATTPPQFGRTPAPRTAPARPAGIRPLRPPRRAPWPTCWRPCHPPPSRECFVTLQSMHRDRIRFLHLTLGDADQPEQVQGDRSGLVAVPAAQGVGRRRDEPRQGRHPRPLRQRPRHVQAHPRGTQPVRPRVVLGPQLRSRLLPRARHEDGRRVRPGRRRRQREPGKPRLDPLRQDRARRPGRTRGKGGRRRERPDRAGPRGPGRVRRPHRRPDPRSGRRQGGPAHVHRRLEGRPAPRLHAVLLAPEPGVVLRDGRDLRLLPRAGEGVPEVRHGHRGSRQGRHERHRDRGPGRGRQRRRGQDRLADLADVRRVELVPDGGRGIRPGGRAAGSEGCRQPQAAGLDEQPRGPHRPLLRVKPGRPGHQGRHGRLPRRRQRPQPVAHHLERPGGHAAAGPSRPGRDRRQEGRHEPGVHVDHHRACVGGAPHRLPDRQRQGRLPAGPVPAQPRVRVLGAHHRRRLRSRDGSLRLRPQRVDGSAGPGADQLRVGPVAGGRGPARSDASRDEAAAHRADHVDHARRPARPVRRPEGEGLGLHRPHPVPSRCGRAAVRPHGQRSPPGRALLAARCDVRQRHRQGSR